MGDSTAVPRGEGPTMPSPSGAPASGSPQIHAAAPTGAGILEADPDIQGDEPDADAGSLLSFSSHPLSDTTSVASSVYKFREENGRTYHAYKEGAYFMPNDERERERLDLSHNLFLRLFDGQLYLSPAGRPGSKPLKRVLDAGTGTGIWAMDFADEHPEAAVVGVDLSPIQPSFVPPNVEFFVDDLESEWTFANPFDFIYGRMMNGSIHDWPKLIRQAYEHLAPGGYLELCDPCNPLVSDDGTLPADSPLNRWNTLLQEGSEKLGAPMDAAARYRQHLVDAGFRNVVQVDYKWPTNSWPRDPKYKEVGQWCFVNNMMALQAISLRTFTKVLGWTPVELEALLVDVRKDLKNRNIHAYWPVYVVYGQKPE